MGLLQIQYNYIDEFAQAGRAGLSYAAARNIPIMIMEPLKGGRLANRLPKEAVDAFAASGKDRSPAEWALRWLWAQKEVFLVLSGMNDLLQLEENIRIASLPREEMLDAADLPISNGRYKPSGGTPRSTVPHAATACPCPAGVDTPCVFAATTTSMPRGGTSGLRNTSCARRSSQR